MARNSGNSGSHSTVKNAQEKERKVAYRFVENVEITRCEEDNVITFVESNIEAKHKFLGEKTLHHSSEADQSRLAPKYTLA